MMHIRVGNTPERPTPWTERVCCRATLFPLTRRQLPLQLLSRGSIVVMASCPPILIHFHLLRQLLQLQLLLLVHQVMLAWTPSSTHLVGKIILVEVISR